MTARRPCSTRWRSALTTGRRHMHYSKKKSVKRLLDWALRVALEQREPEIIERTMTSDFCWTQS